MHESSCKYEKNWPICVDDDWVSNELWGQQGTHGPLPKRSHGFCAFGFVLFFCFGFVLSLRDDEQPFTLGQHEEVVWGKARRKAELQ